MHKYSLLVSCFYENNNSVQKEKLYNDRYGWCQWCITNSKTIKSHSSAFTVSFNKCIKIHLMIAQCFKISRRQIFDWKNCNTKSVNNSLVVVSEPITLSKKTIEMQEERWECIYIQEDGVVISIWRIEFRKLLRGIVLQWFVLESIFSLLPQCTLS